MNIIKFYTSVPYDRLISNKSVNYAFSQNLCKANINKINSFAKVLKAKNFVQVGIGGSALAASAALSFLQKGTQEKRYFCLDNIDPQRLDKILKLNPDETVFHVVSKSGTTIETLSQLFIIKQHIKNPNIVISTDDRDTFLRSFGVKHGYEIFDIPTDVGGRYSAFTSVALLPLAFFGYDIDSYIEAAKQVVRDTRENGGFPIDLANLVVSTYDRCKIFVMFAYKDRLYEVADWFRQLWAESLGKNGIGQTPIKALGTTDQHSQLQLYQEGIKDKLIVFLDTISDIDFTIAESFEPFNYLKGKSIAKIMEVEKQSTRKALDEAQVSTAEIFLENINEATLGAFFCSLMITTAKVGEFWKINPFDQPGVELGKKYTRERLQND
jgi:glucose-6-phosphate isomerase